MMENSNESQQKAKGDLDRQNSEEIVQNILGQVVGKIPNHQLDGNAEEEEDSEVIEETANKVVDDSNEDVTSKSDPEIPAQDIPTPSEDIPTSSKKAKMSKESSADSKDSKDSNSVEMDNIYHVKWIGWNSSKIPIITQNSNGPCPMLAIANILLLRGKMTLQDGCEIVSSEQLLETLGKFYRNTRLFHI